MKLFILFLLTLSTPASAKHPITAHDLVHVKGIMSPTISPDGKTVFYVVRKQCIHRNIQKYFIYTAPVGRKSSGRKLISSTGSSFSPSVSPDGKYLAFIDTRKDGPQIWVLPLKKPGEAKRLSYMPFGVNGPLVWSPDSKYILYNSEVPPECNNVKCLRKKASTKKWSSGYIFDRLMFRHWNAWRYNNVNHMFKITFPDGKITLMTPGIHDVPPVALGSGHDYVISPDGKEIAYVSNTDTLPAKSTNNDIFLYNVKTGKKRRLTKGKGNDFAPMYSPDGKYLAYISLKRPGYESDKGVIMLYNRRNRRTKALTASFDLSVRDFAFAPDKRVIFFNALDKGYVNLYRVTFSGRIYKDRKKSFVTEFIPLKKYAMLAINQTISSPPELFYFPGAYSSKKVSSIRKGRSYPVSKANDELMKELLMGKVEEKWIKGANNDKIHVLILKPPKFNSSKKYPVIFLLHGGPQGAFGFDFHPRWNSQLFAAPGYVVVMVNFHGSVGYGQKFTDSIRGDWGGKPYKDVMNALKFVKRLPYVKSDKICAAGASYGGYLIDWIGTQTNEFKCLISHSGVFNLESMYGSTEELWFPEWENKGTPWSNRKLYRKWSPSNYVQNWKTPVLIIHGAFDFRVTIDQSFQLFTSVKRLGVKARLLYFPDENHFVFKPRNRMLWWKTVHSWFKTYLK